MLFNYNPANLCHSYLFSYFNVLTVLLWFYKLVTLYQAPGTFGQNGACPVSNLQSPIKIQKMLLGESWSTWKETSFTLEPLVLTTVPLCSIACQNLGLA